MKSFKEYYFGLFLDTVSERQLETKIQNWVQLHTGTSLAFKCSDACDLLAELGLLNRDAEGKNCQKILHMLTQYKVVKHLKLLQTFNI